MIGYCLWQMAPAGSEQEMAQSYMDKIDKNSDGQIHKPEWIAFFQALEEENGQHTEESLLALKRTFGMAGVWHQAFKR